MILGQPGGGKSYEAVAFHILPTLEDGRKVITNLPLNVDAFYGVIPESRKLLEIRTQSQKQGAHCFSVRDDFEDDWRDDDTGRGPLFVIDECHKMYPRIGCDKDVLEFFAEHRHAGIDIILVTQAYGKIHPDIRDMVQMVYRVKKMTAFGKSDRYIRKVQDGIRGEIMSTSEREYESKYFPLYKSHTASNSAVFEADAKDISPTYKKWLFASAAFVLIGLSIPFVAKAFSGKKAVTELEQGGTPPAGGIPDLTNVTPTNPPTLKPQITQTKPESSQASEPDQHPFQGYMLHLQGAIQSKHRVLMTFLLTQNEKVLSMITNTELEQAGYKVTYMSECVAKLEYPNIRPFFVVCSHPSVAPVPRTDALNQSSDV